MPKYRMVVALPMITHNGKQYMRGEVVMIQNLDELEAERINRKPHLTGFKAELVDDKSPVRVEADALGIKYPAKIGDAKLQEKIDEFKAAQK